LSKQLEIVTCRWPIIGLVLETSALVRPVVLNEMSCTIRSSFFTDK